MECSGMSEISAGADPIKANSAASQEKAPLSAWWAVGALLIVVVYATVDRQIFILLAEPIRLELGLSDAQLGMLQGIGLALISVITTYPIAALADRYDRRVVMAACILVWSVAVVACGLSPNFMWLFIFASLVGIGEAGAGPASYAIVGDLFPQSQRHIANSVIAIGGRLGGSLGIFLAGVIVTAAAEYRPFLPGEIASLSDWRLGFLAAALFCPVAIVLILTLPKTASGKVAGDKQTASERAPILPFLRANARAQGGFIIGYGFAHFGFTSIGTWVPIIAARDFGQTPLEAGAWIGGMAFVTTVVGFVVGTAALQVLRKRFGPALPMLAMAVVLVVCAAVSVLLYLAQDIPQLYVAWGVQATFLMIVAIATPTIIQNMTPTHIRARLFAIGSIVAIAFGSSSPLVVGLVSDLLTSLPRSLMIAAAGTSIISMLISAVILFWTAPHYQRLAEEVARDES
jgi:MFS family permease